MVAVRFLNSRIESMKQQNVIQEIQQLRLTKKELEDRITTLSEQVSLLKQELNEKVCEAKATHEQVIMLTERAATDEGIAQQLMKKLDEASRNAPIIAQLPPSPIDESALLKLREANELYAAVVKRYDNEERRRSAIPPFTESVGQEERPTTISLHTAIRDLRRDNEDCHRRISQLEELLSQKELESSRMVRWIASKNDSWEEHDVRSLDTSIHEAASHGNLASLSETGSSKNSADDHQLTPIHQRRIRTQLATLVHSSSAKTGESNPMLLDSLPQLRGMTPREKKLSERISLLESQLKLLEEQRKQKEQILEEVEKHRTELLMSANKAVEANRKENQVLKVQLERLVSLGGKEFSETSLDQQKPEVTPASSANTKTADLELQRIEYERRLLELQTYLSQNKSQNESIRSENGILRNRIQLLEQHNEVISSQAVAASCIRDDYIAELDRRCSLLVEIAVRSNNSLPNTTLLRDTDRSNLIATRNENDIRLIDAHFPVKIACASDVDVFSMFCAQSSPAVSRPVAEFDPFA